MQRERERERERARARARARTYVVLFFSDTHIRGVGEKRLKDVEKQSGK
jgi:hypothetical protein